MHVVHAHLTGKSSNSVLSQGKSSESDKISRDFLVTENVHINVSC